MTIEVEATETTIPALLESIARGDEVQLLRNGEAVAILKPQRSSEQVERALGAFAEATERAKRLGLKFDLNELKADRELGRR